MKYFTLPKIVGAGVLTVGLALMPLTLPATAQNSVDENTAAPGERVADEEGDRDFDWGWLGLLGLIGLAGLKKQDSTEYRNPSDAGTRSNLR